jgi:putative transposase
MARLPRVVAVGVPHHVTQRGNDRRFVLNCDADRMVYWQLLLRNCQEFLLSLVGYCLMSNHVHLIVVPQRSDSIARALKNTHGRYATYLNAREQSCGHVWQGRYYSCPLDQPHFWAALRYTELNPVRAGIADKPEQNAWSSAALHCGATDAEIDVDLEFWRQAWSPDAWRSYLRNGDAGEEAEVIRRNTHTGRPLGGSDFVCELEKSLRRRLAPQKGGRPAKAPDDARQELLFFGEAG